MNNFPLCATLASRRPAPPSRTARMPRTLVALALAGFMMTVSAAPAPAPGTAQAVEKRIGDMHGKLHIAADQETQWAAVAQTMRDNQRALEPLIAEREKNAADATALQDLDSFATVSEAHAGGIRRFIAAFEPLYAAMPAAQKKEADALFRAGPGKMGATK